MVIQRVWRASNQSTESSSIQQSSSSEDSNSSWHTQSNSTSSSQQQRNGATASPKICMKEMADSVLRAFRTRYNGRSAVHQTSREIGERSMELLRMNIQELFDEEIDSIVQKYIETYFRPALKNVKENIDDSGINEEYLNKVRCDLLENAKHRYGSIPTNERTISRECLIKSEYVQTYDQLIFPMRTSVLKRKDSCSSSSELSSSDQSPTHQTFKRIPSNVQMRANAHFWNASNLTSDTLFVLDFKANRALGFVEKERLTNLHPELMRYIVDMRDKEWMIQNKILSPVHKHFRVMLLVLDEVKRIVQSEQFRLRSTVKQCELLGFKIPDFMLQKMKAVFNELCQKSQQLLTTPSLTTTTNAILSVTVAEATTTTSPSVTNETTATTQTPTSSPSTIVTMNSPKPPISTATTTAVSVASMGTVGTLSAISPIHVTGADSIGTNSNGSCSSANSNSAASPRPLMVNISRNSLSSSHATLSALLSSSSENSFASNADVNEQ